MHVSDLNVMCFPITRSGGFNSINRKDYLRDIGLVALPERLGHLTCFPGENIRHASFLPHQQLVLGVDLKDSNGSPTVMSTASLPIRSGGSALFNQENIPPPVVTLRSSVETN